MTICKLKPITSFIKMSKEKKNRLLLVPALKKILSNIFLKLKKAQGVYTTLRSLYALTVPLTLNCMDNWMMNYNRQFNLTSNHQISSQLTLLIISLMAIILLLYSYLVKLMIVKHMIRTLSYHNYTKLQLLYYLRTNLH